MLKIPFSPNEADAMKVFVRTTMLATGLVAGLLGVVADASAQAPEIAARQEIIKGQRWCDAHDGSHSAR